MSGPAGPPAVEGAEQPGTSLPPTELTSAAPAGNPAPTGSPGPTGNPGPGHQRPPVERRGGGDGRRGRAQGQDSSERSLRSLVTTRSTQVSSTAAMRAREVAVPNADDLAAAEAELVIVRRHYVPPTSLSAGRRPDRRGQGRPG